MERKRICYKPLWAGAVEGWTKNYAAKHYWRVAPEHDFEDLLAEGRLCFEQARARYPEINNGRHLMGIYARMFSNRINDMAWRRTRRPDKAVSSLAGATTEDVTLEAASADDGLFAIEQAMLFADAPPAMRVLIAKLVTAPDAGGLAPRMGYAGPAAPLPARRRRETTNEFLCRLAGLNPAKRNLVAETLAFLGKTFKDGKFRPV